MLTKENHAWINPGTSVRIAKRQGRVLRRDGLLVLVQWADEQEWVAARRLRPACKAKAAANS